MHRGVTCIPVACSHAASFPSGGFLEPLIPPTAVGAREFDAVLSMRVLVPAYANQ